MVQYSDNHRNMFSAPDAEQLKQQRSEFFSLTVAYSLRHSEQFNVIRIPPAREQLQPLKRLEE